MGEKPHALSWSLGFLGATCQWFLNLISGVFPSHEAYWLTVNAFALILITLGIRGHCQRTDCQRLPENLWPFAALVYAAIVWTTVVDPHTGFRMALVPAAAAGTLFLSALMIIRHREASRPAEWAAASAMVVFGLTQGIAAGMAVLQGPVGDEAYLSLYVHYNFLTLPAGYMAMGMFVIFMLASDISEQMKEIAVRDELTGLLNRRGFNDQAAAAFAQARRSDLPVSVVMADIDRFKFINDEYGHATGDTALEHFANVLNSGRRANDILARVGGEEFALIVPGTELRAAMQIANELRAKIDSQPMLLDGENLPMTASFGVATISAKDSCMSDIIVRADRALYRSKRAGRNQVDLESSQMLRATDGSLKPVTI
ncbi:MAG: GGDEF domain-containing protein [Gammaproteobacteria bacterium]|nr:GGDEF domain-containing protein [Gammaproteobacteria bacterium]